MVPATSNWQKRPNKDDILNNNSITVMFTSTVLCLFWRVEGGDTGCSGFKTHVRCLSQLVRGKQYAAHAKPCPDITHSVSLL